MATLREIRRKITSVKKTQQITRAMKMVAAAKLRRAQERMNQIRPYADSLASILANVSAKVDHSLNPYLQERGDDRHCYIVIAGDRGLCGSFNTNVLRAGRFAVEGALQNDKQVHIFAVGKKASDFFRKRNMPIGEHLSGFFNELEFTHALQIARSVGEKFIQGEFDRVFLVYTRAESPVKQEVLTEQVLPIQPQQVTDEKFNADYIFEPSPATILNELCPKNLNIQVWRALVDSYYAEEGARMVAMDNATENAQEMIENLTLYYNKVRQATITREISEIVSGAEALK